MFGFEERTVLKLVDQVVGFEERTVLELADRVIEVVLQRFVVTVVVVTGV